MPRFNAQRVQRSTCRNIEALSVERFPCYRSPVAVDPFSPFQRDAFTSGRGFTYYAETPGLPLSLKCMFNGRTLYRFDRKEIVVDDAGYLILNEHQPYSIEIASPTKVETFVLWFPTGWAEEVWRTLDNRPDKLLDGGPNGSGEKVSFFERYTLHDSSVSPKAKALRAAFKSPQPMEDSWVEERLRDLLAAMLTSQHSIRREVGNLPAVRAATREELWRRVNRARDYLHAHSSSSVRLSALAKIACLSPFHLLRVFQSAFGQTPHQYLNRCRIERAKFLLAKTQLPVTAICLESGFTSLGSFSALFTRICGMSPRLWRQHHGNASNQNSNIREVYLMGAT